MINNEFSNSRFEYEPNRGYFSEDMVYKEGEVFEEFKDPIGKRIIHYGMLSKKMFSEKYTHVLHAIDDPQRFTLLQPALRWKKFSTKVAISFPIQTIKPKVQLLHRSAPGCLPREVEVERRLRQYSQKSISDILIAAGVDMASLIPVHILKEFLSPLELRNKYSSQFSRLPLEWFDDFDYDCMRPQDWLDLGILADERHPIPAEAFLPTDFDFEHAATMNEPIESIRNHIYVWVKVSVRDYDPVKMRWLVTDLEMAKSYRIPRIFLMFLAEDPINFCNRIKNALERRTNADRHMKFNLILDSMLLTGVPIPKPVLLNKIFMLTLPLKWRKNPNKLNRIEPLMDEIKLDYQRFLASIDIHECLNENQTSFAFLELPSADKPQVKEPFMLNEYNIDRFEEAYEWLRLNTLYCLPAVINTVDSVVVECAHVSRLLFFTTNLSKTASLADFQNAQEIQSSTTLSYIKGQWIDNISGSICMCLRSVGKGWFDIRTDTWTSYLFSKLSRLLELVKYMMQNSLRNLVESSIRLWTHLLCRPCNCLLKVQDDFIWNAQDLIFSPFHPGQLHVFFMVLSINEDGPFYSTDPSEYDPVLKKLFDDPIYESHFVHQVDSRVMTKLVYPDTIFLSSVGKMEGVVDDARELTIFCYEKAIIPLKAYCKVYDMHCAFFHLDKLVYLKEFKAADKSPQDFKEEISMHFRMKANLEVTLPPSIQIGPFLVSVEPLKVFLVKKRQELATKLIDMLLEKLRNETQEIIDEYTEIIRRLSEKPVSIEYIFETREWMETIPDSVTVLENAMRLKLFEYEILDFFWVPLPNEDFKVKWAALASPLKVQKQIVSTREMFEEETERFTKQQSSDLVVYDERVEGLNMTISQFATQFDTNKTTEISIEIKKLWKQINETMDMGRLLNKRQALFENPPIDLRPMIQLLESFTPYKVLWVTGADFIKSEEAWLGNPLPNVAPEGIRITMDEYIEANESCIVIFKELPKVQGVSYFFQKRMNEFMPLIDIIEFVKNPAWIMLHWQELCKATEMEIKFSVAMNMEYLLSKGIAKFYDTVKEISISATENQHILEAAEREAERLKLEEEQAILDRKNRRRGRKLA